MALTKVQKTINCLLYIAIALMLCMALKIFLPALNRNRETRKEYAELRSISEQKTAECIRLIREVHDLEHSPEAIEKVAREKFNYCKEGEIILRYDK